MSSDVLQFAAGVGAFRTFDGFWCGFFGNFGWVTFFDVACDVDQFAAGIFAMVAKKVFCRESSIFFRLSGFFGGW